ncbi:MAG: baseplate J/gp47 family protein [Bacteroidales bacterium]|nr:baseplate J/gp47 family protein [Bacteroidales bacterium]
MSENRINYLHRSYDECKQDLLDITRKYYPDVFGNINDASIGAWFVEMLSDVYDALNYHIDRVYQETDIDSAQQLSSLQNIARTSGLRIPGRKAALCEIEIGCEIPLYNTDGDNLSQPDWRYAPVFKRGCLFSTGMVTFELQNDVDFNEQFDENGYSNRVITPTRDSNGVIISYSVKKLAVVVAGQSKIFKKVITNSDIKPFMEVLIQDSDILGVDSIILKQGTDINSDPLLSEFSVDLETYYDKLGNTVDRFFEVDNLIDQYRFGYAIEHNSDNHPIGDGDSTDAGSLSRYNYYNPVWDEIEEEVNEETGETVTIRRVVNGEWKRLKNKFITEYTDNWYLKVIFGAGIEKKYGKIPSTAEEFTKNMMSRMNANDYMGVLPTAGKTMFILYRVGGGDISNIAENTLTNITYSNLYIEGDCTEGDYSTKVRNVRNSISVTNPTISYGGKDEPSSDEIRQLIKYNSASQNRAVTIHDYNALVGKLPAMYGTPFRWTAVEQNNKVSIYTLGLDYNGYLTAVLSEKVADNIKEWLRPRRMINDFVEILSGRVINLSFIVTIYKETDYETGDLVKRVIDLIYDYMDIRRHWMGEDICVGDLIKEIGKLDGVLNFVNIRIFNKVGDGYSDDVTSMPLVDTADCCAHDSDVDTIVDNDDIEIDLRASDYYLYGDANTMFEVKYKESDITVVVKQRS